MARVRLTNGGDEFFIDPATGNLLSGDSREDSEIVALTVVGDDTNGIALALNTDVKLETGDDIVIPAVMAGVAQDPAMRTRDTDENGWIARSYADAPEIDGLVYIDSDAELSIGEFVEVKITDSDDYDLYGEPA